MSKQLLIAATLIFAMLSHAAQAQDDPMRESPFDQARLRGGVPA